MTRAQLFGQCNNSDQQAADQQPVSMAWIFEKSPLWRSIVARTRESPVFYAGFGVACFAVPYALGKAVMWGTNPDVDPVREELLRRRQTVHNQVCWVGAECNGLAA